jgi:hypothetical protein
MHTDIENLMQNVLAISCFWNSNICYSQTVYLNRLKLSQVEYYNEYDFLEFFLTSLNFAPVLLERNLNLSEKIEKIPKNRIHCNIQHVKVSACLDIRFVNNKYLKFRNN